MVVSGHLPPLYPEESYERTVEEAKIAFKLLGVDEYQFGSIPATFVLDENGIIVARNLRGAALYKKIEELLSNI